MGQTRYLVHYIYRSGKSVRYAQEQLSSFKAPKFRVSVGGEYGFTRETQIEHAAKCFYNAKI
jgi:hypothetical protein